MPPDSNENFPQERPVQSAVGFNTLKVVLGPPFLAWRLHFACNIAGVKLIHPNNRLHDISCYVINRQVRSQH